MHQVGLTCHFILRMHGQTNIKKKYHHLNQLEKKFVTWPWNNTAAVNIYNDSAFQYFLASSLLYWFTAHFKAIDCFLPLSSMTMCITFKLIFCLVRSDKILDGYKHKSRWNYLTPLKQNIHNTVETHLRFVLNWEKSKMVVVSKLHEDYYCDCKKINFTLTLNPMMSSFNPIHIYTFIFTF